MFQGSKGIGCIPDDKNVWVFREPDLFVAHPDSKLERALDVRHRPAPVVNRLVGNISSNEVSWV